MITLVVFCFNKYVQPVLPTSMNSSLLLIVASLGSAVSFLAVFNDVVEFVRNLGFVRKMFGKRAEELIIYPHHNPPYNAAKILYVGSEIAKDLDVRIEYIDTQGRPQVKVVNGFFPENDPLMTWRFYKYDFLEPNQVAYFHLIRRKTTLDGKARVVITFTGATSGRSVTIEREFELKDF